MREEFEAWVRTQVPEPSLATVLAYSAGNDLYLNTHIQGRYEGWKASRAALRVELPDKAEFVEYYEDLEGGTFNWQRYMVAIQEALQQAGI
ncbi:TPA: hypothetical protein SL675_003878 [Pseudomonas aeruginosa]|nr:hypothetical protein [Pseudomonas aeruginosa]HEJ2068492.1 hypothetical protein [Pseudomonas aeruginosa]HEJ4469263.1 hypothetical protein [Pseudomonas aeruginosa]HEJ5099251.1 hypothetical protein [Pseudomonas aeruginosa]HEJ5111201.1 hypothetical protein [Pseudomonas aeruginosa]